MSVEKYYEVTCTYCGCAEHFTMGINWKEQARGAGWRISKKGEFCTPKCFKENKTLTPQP